jgi:AcrR family transcriptional regulator
MGIRERKERERERRRQQIMVAAKRVFADKGFNKATMEDIAKEAELSPGTLYLYFKNKDELYASLSLRILQYLLMRLEHVNRTTSETDPSQNRLQALKEAMYDVYEFDPLILINMFHLQSSDALKNLTPNLLNEIQHLSQSALEAMATIFEKGVKEGVFIDQRPIAIADITWALFSGVVLTETSKKIIGNADNDLRNALDMAFDILARGIAK